MLLHLQRYRAFSAPSGMLSRTPSGGVADEIMLDENILFEQVTPEWEEFCTQTLDFSIPDFCQESIPETDQASSEA